MAAPSGRAVRHFASLRPCGQLPAGQLGYHPCCSQPHPQKLLDPARFSPEPRLTPCQPHHRPAAWPPPPPPAHARQRAGPTEPAAPVPAVAFIPCTSAATLRYVHSSLRSGAPHSLRLLRSGRFGHCSAVPPFSPPHRCCSCSRPHRSSLTSASRTAAGPRQARKGLMPPVSPPDSVAGRRPKKPAPCGQSLRSSHAGRSKARFAERFIGESPNPPPSCPG